MKIDPAGLPFITGALVPAAAAALARKWGWSVPFVVAAGFFTFFFRDPERMVADEEDVIVSPADGEVIVAGEADPRSAPAGSWQQVSIFLSPMDVHVNRIPFTGRVTRVAYTPGRFLPAFRPEAASQNERNELWIERDGTTIVARQLVGILARRIVCRVSAGEEVRAGQRFGVMKFGSRMDVFVPATATLVVSVGETVRAGETVLARLAPATGA